MPAYNFKSRFAAMVESGKKRQTIRSTDRGAKPGQLAYLYTGMRTKSCRKLAVGTLTKLTQIEIGRNGCGEPYAVLVHDQFLAHKDIDLFARDDGFQSGEEMVSFFEEEYGLPFKGFLHVWVLTTPSKEECIKRKFGDEVPEG